MQTDFILQLGGFIPPPTCRKLTSMHRQRKNLVAAAAIRDPTSRKFADFRAQETKSKPATAQKNLCDETKSKPAMADKTVHNDNWFQRLAIRHLSSSIEAITGVETKEKGYDGLIEAAGVVARRKDGRGQQELVEEALNKAFPAAVMKMLKSMLPQSKFSRKLFAMFTTIFFSWLVGPCEVRESDFQGKREKNVVYIPKCRFLEATNCVAMCTNLCKLPCQKFINNSMGMPTNMIPNFEDQSCEIIFGQHPLADDPALKQPCYRTSCIAKRKHGVGCSS